jgi:hypothetical protein
MTMRASRSMAPRGRGICTKQRNRFQWCSAS